MALVPGTRLGRYEITAEIGAGGMGEVYRARDTNLGRDVAIKVLPERFAQDADRLARFEREATTLASLNHANIAIVYGFEKAEGVRALVMELVDGPTLADRLAGRRLPVDETLAIARQVAEALEAAHEQGIVHRDLKPSNIKLRPDGTVKVLDFGLAKAMEPAGALSGFSQSPTITTPAMTHAGMILGTAAYMSPEQARGKPVDKRADVWAFGCVIFEMLAGRRVFEGDEVSDTLAFVLTKEPDWGTLPADTPVALRRLLRRCLVKDRTARLPDIGSARLDVDEARTEMSGLPADVRPADAGATTRRTAAWASATLVIAALAAAAVWLVMRAQPASLPVVRASINVLPADRLLGGVPLDPSMGQGRPSRTALSFSPDGRSLVFSAERQGRVQLYLRRLDQMEAMPIAGTDGASNPFFSPDGQSLGFHADGALKKVPVGGGPVIALCKVDLIYGASWGRADQIVFAQQTGGLWQVPAAGGTPASLTKPGAGEQSHRLPQLLPDGQTVLFTVTNVNFPSWDETLIVAQSLATGSRKVLINGGADARFVATGATGHLVYVRRGTLMAVPFDLSRLEVTGAPVGLVADVMQAAGIQPVQIDTGAGQFAVAESGSLVYVTGGMFQQDRWSLVWVDRTGRSEPLRIPPGAYLAPRLSPDGKRVAFSTSTGDWDLWTYDVSRQIVARLPMEGEQSVPLWTPDGSRLAFGSYVGGIRGVFLMNPDMSSTAEKVTTPADKTCGWPNAWTSDGRALAVACFEGARVVSRTGNVEPRPIVTSAGSAGQSDFSPDDRWLAYSTFQTQQVYVQPYPALDRQQQVSTVNGTAPAWRRDGRELYYVENASAEGSLKIRVMAVGVTTTPTFSAGTPHMLFEGPFRTDGPFRGYDVTPDGQRFLMVQEIPQPPSRVSQMVLVLNWVDELKRRVPAR